MTRKLVNVEQTRLFSLQKMVRIVYMYHRRLCGQENAAMFLAASTNKMAEAKEESCDYAEAPPPPN